MGVVNSIFCAGQNRAGGELQCRATWLEARNKLPESDSTGWVSRSAISCHDHVTVYKDGQIHAIQVRSCMILRHLAVRLRSPSISIQPAKTTKARGNPGQTPDSCCGCARCRGVVISAAWPFHSQPPRQHKHPRLPLSAAGTAVLALCPPYISGLAADLHNSSLHPRPHPSRSYTCTDPDT